ncbi:MAG: glycine--tRNA ligase [Candidatus Heimdallarchaeota archaeon]|nr:glycine--tRNA ligase [Candidatus Heimdallarchaeota archaeon]
MAKKKKEPSLQEEIVDVCLRRGIVFPTADIYNGLAGSYEFGPVGSAIKQAIVELWRETFIRSEDNVYEIDGSIILPESVFAASGHIDSFNDPLTQCEKCKAMHRADHVIEEFTGESAEGLSHDELFELIEKHEVACPSCKGTLSKPREFNMMFQTNIGPVSGTTGYLRPETAQNIFINFRRVAHSMRAKLPFGIAQVGRAYRNEISPRNFLIRMREFEQMELEMFVDPDEINNHPNWDEYEQVEIRLLTQEAQEKGGLPITITLAEGIERGYIYNQYMGYYMAVESLFIESLGIDKNTFWFRHLLDHETAHYSAANYDLEIQFPFGIVECIGLAYRTDYDLMKHQEKSKMKMHIDQNGKKVIPHVIEPSIGVQRVFYAALLANYQKEGREWTWFKFPNSIAPWSVLITPLMKKDGLLEEAKSLYWELKDMGIDAIFDESGAIGKRYARNDEIGVPFAVTIDYNTLEDETVTLRDRNTTEQIRIHKDSLPDVLKEMIMDITTWDELKEEFGLIE